MSDEQDLPQDLGISAYDAQDFEKEVIEKVNHQIEDNMKQFENSKFEKVQTEIQILQDQISITTDEKEEKKLSKKLEKLEEKLAKLHKETPVLQDDHIEEETEKERLIRTGVINPFENLENIQKRKRSESLVPKKKKKTINVKDDGNYNMYMNRMNDLEQSEKDEEFVFFDGGYSISAVIYDNLFDYQKTSIRWLWEVHQQRVGSILADEMGLGKTVQMIAFLSGLVSSKLYKPSIIVCPATVMSQWVKEIHEWAPKLRAVIFHEMGTHDKTDDEILDEVCQSDFGVLVTTYDAIRNKQDKLLSRDWEYIILDEGHKIRSPDSEITLAVKKFETYHRIILTGTPIQNNLKELWSLFDFIYPGKLGTLPVFQNQFAIPISQGGYVNAKSFEVETAYKCSVVLRNLISPYLLRRLKKDVITLPKKTEQVLFTKLTPYQLEVYKRYIDSKEVNDCFNEQDNSKGLVFKAISVLRKICNHPSLINESIEFNPLDSGKMVVVDKLLTLWKEQNHRVLLYSQSVKMLDILQEYMKGKYKVLRMDGTTNISSRSEIIDKFNNDESVFCFLLTTKVGGIGINLTGADRILIYDPDWNPSTDQQALERSWRVGQTKDVHVYRLMTSGTIEEKMYHRQIFKQFLSNKILKDPRQTRFFKENDLKDLFQLGVEYERDNMGTETGSLFRTSEIKQTREDVDEEDKKSETYILKKLLDGDDVSSAFNHDEIISGKPETQIVLQEAQKIAKNAVQVLLESSRECMESSIGTPTWTGSKGAAGRRFGSKSTVPSGQSSATLFNNLETKKQDSNLFNHGSQTIQVSKEKESVDLIKDLSDFLKSQPNQEAKTNEIVAKFKERVKGEMVLTFKPMLREIAKFNKKTGTWKLL